MVLGGYAVSSDRAEQVRCVPGVSLVRVGDVRVYRIGSRGGGSRRFRIGLAERLTRASIFFPRSVSVTKNQLAISDRIW